jgi:hypothetical protein
MPAKKKSVEQETLPGVPATPPQTQAQIIVEPSPVRHVEIVEVSEEEKELLQLERQKTAVLDKVKHSLAKSLASACDSLKLLKKLGVKSPLGEEQYAEFCGVLGIAPQIELPFSTPTAATPKESKDKETGEGRTNKKWPELSVAAAVAYAKEQDGSLINAKFIEYFGQKWNGFKKTQAAALAEKFTQKTVGVSVVWTLK